jgi:hypothetical protein
MNDWQLAQLPNPLRPGSPGDRATRRQGDKVIKSITLSPCRPVTLSGKHGRTKLHTLFLLLVLALLLGGCARLRRAPAGVALDLTAFLPSEWKAIGDLQTINIDGDTASEYLLLFTYDPVPGVTDGPVGAIILDPQMEAVLTEADISILARPSGFPNPHAVLPSYWLGAGQGFIAPPDQAGNVTVHQVAFVTSNDGTQAPLVDTLVIRGGGSYLTFVWWKNVIEGYGVYQLYAPGGFEGVDWAAWQDAPQRLDRLVGVQPLNNRSLFCRKTQYDRVEVGAPVNNATTERAPYRQPISYQARDLGLSFCYGAPAHPFYPEGVVMAYLTDANRRAGLVFPANDSTALAQLTAIFDPATVVRVDDARGYQAIPISVYDRVSRSTALTTTACAQVQIQPSAGGAPEERWLLFTLRHQPPRLEPSSPDQLLVERIEVEPAPPNGVTLHCKDLVRELP